MYSILFSKIDMGMDQVLIRMHEIVKEDSKVAIFPWAFPTEINSEKFENEYFPINGRRYLKYASELAKLGIKMDNITVCNPYKHKKEELIKIIQTSDILLFPGGNPEMLFKKVLHSTEIIYEIKHFEGIVIGESAGTELQLTRYFITSKNNFYHYFAFYDGFGLLDDPFYVDVHTSDDADYLLELQNCANKVNKRIYAIYDDGVLIYNRKNKDVERYGQVKIIDPKE